MMQGRQAGVPLGPGSMFANANNVQIRGSVFRANRYYGGNDSGTAIWRFLQAIPNFRRIYQDMLSKATEGTGMWLLRNEIFRVWLEPNGDIKILWGSGMPGAGKTVLASIVIQRLEALRKESDEPICVCFVYFRYSDHADLTPKRILEVLLKQTLEQHPECRSLIEETYTLHAQEDTEPTESQLVALLRQITNEMSVTFYVLDALDEAPPNVRLTVLRTLVSLNVKLFITSRPLKAVQATFPEAHRFHISAQDHDIELHVDKAFNESPGLLNLLRQEGPGLQEEILSTIKSKSGGMFLHASLQMDVLRGCVTLHQVRRVLDECPARIEDVYLETWRRILEEPQELVFMAKAVLVWVLYVSRSMTIDELERAVATSFETYKFEPERLAPRTTLIDVCQGLLAVEDESKLVHLVHYTAKEHLQRLLDESFPHPHSLLANVCMTHLVECGFQNTTISSEEEFKGVLQNDPLLTYASEAWSFHALQSLWVDDVNRTTRFVKDSSAFPAFTSLDRTFHFDILTPLHMMGVYHLPLGLVSDLKTHNPNIATTVHRQTPLMLASRVGFESLVEFLLARPEIQVNLVSKGGSSALMVAAQHGYEGIVKLFLARPEIQVNLANREGWTALTYASTNGHDGIVRLLAPSETRRALVSLMGTHSAKRLVLQSMLPAKALTIENDVEIYEFRLKDALVVSIASLPAFEDDDIEHNLSACKTLFNFFQPREPGTCNSVIMAYDLSRHRLRHCDLLNFRLVKDLCGTQFLGDRLAILTTSWLSEPPVELAQLEGRESDLRNLKEDCFLHSGARYHRHNLPESPSMVDLIAALAAQPALPLTIQEEISNHLQFNETAVGRALAERLREHQEIVRKRLDSLAVDLENLKTECWDADERDAMQKDQEVLEMMFARLNKVAQEGFT